MRMGRALGRFQRERGLALPRPVAANSPLQSYFINADFASVASDLFGERMPDQRSSGLRRPCRMRVIGRWEEPTVHWWLNTLTIMVGLLVMLACGGDTDDRMLRRYARCLTDTSTTLYRMTTSGASGTVTLNAEAVEERLRGQLERGELSMEKIRADYARYCE